MSRSCLITEALKIILHGLPEDDVKELVDYSLNHVLSTSSRNKYAIDAVSLKCGRCGAIQDDGKFGVPREVEL